MERSDDKTLHSGERIQKVENSHAGFAGYVWAISESTEKKLRVEKISGNVWTVPQQSFDR